MLRIFNRVKERWIWERIFFRSNGKIIDVRAVRSVVTFSSSVVHYGHVEWTVGRATRVRTRKGIRETTR